MLFLFKKKEIVIDAFTTDKVTHDLFPIEKAVNNIPTWWKNIPKDKVEKSSFVGDIPLKTMKHCSGIIDYFKCGYILPMWSDVKIKTDESNFWWHFASPTGSAKTHSSEQHNNSLNEHYHIKFECPWYLRASTDVQLLCTMPTWNLVSHLKNIHVLPGVVNPKYVHAINVNCFLYKQEGSFVLDAGAPLYHIAPLEGKEIKIVNHLVSQNELNKFVFDGYPFFEKSFSKVKKYLNRKTV